MIATESLRRLLLVLLAGGTLAVTASCRSSRPLFSTTAISGDSFPGDIDNEGPEFARQDEPDSEPYARRVGIIRSDLRSRQFARAIRRLELFLEAVDTDLERPDGAPTKSEVRTEVLTTIARSGAQEWGAIFDQRQLSAPLKLALLDTIGRTRIFERDANPGMNLPGALRTRRVKLGSRVADLELALTPLARNYGLMLRTHIPEDRGMLFLFPYHGLRSFWAKSCYVPMDLAFVDDRNGTYTITDIHTLTPKPDPLPDDLYPRYPSSAPVRIGIEMRASWFKDHGFKVGDQLDLAKFVHGLEAE